MDAIKVKLAAATTVALVKKHVEVRDRLKLLEDDYEIRKKPFASLKEDLENELFARLNAQGADSIATEQGTVYRYTHKYAKIVDLEAFWRCAVENDAPEMFQARASVSEIEARIEAGATVPGVTVSSYQTARIRKG